MRALGTPRELLFRPANDFVRRFFAEERLGLQLRTLTLGDVFGGIEVDFSSPAHYFHPHTTVHEALEVLTGTGLMPAAHTFTLPQLMAAFGEALQREEDAWKR